MTHLEAIFGPCFYARHNMLPDEPPINADSSIERVYIYITYNRFISIKEFKIYSKSIIDLWYTTLVEKSGIERELYAL